MHARTWFKLDCFTESAGQPDGHRLALLRLLPQVRSSQGAHTLDVVSSRVHRVLLYVSAASSFLCAFIIFRTNLLCQPGCDVSPSSLTFLQATCNEIPSGAGDGPDPFVGRVGNPRQLICEVSQHFQAVLQGHTEIFCMPMSL